MTVFLKWAFFAMLAFHVVHALLMHRNGGAQKNSRISYILLVTQSPLFAVACYFSAIDGVFSRQLISPFYIVLGLLAGHLVFGVSLMITHRSLSDVTAYFFDLKPLWDFVVESPAVLMRFMTVAIVEEVIWRSGAQNAILHAVEIPAVAIVCVAVAFCAVHEHVFTNPLMVTLEFLGFSLLLGGLFYLTHSLILVIVIHAVRDIEIAYLEYAEKVEELGDAALAMQEFEKSLVRQRAEKV